MGRGVKVAKSWRNSSARVWTLIPASFEADTRLNSSLLARNQEKKL